MSEFQKTQKQKEAISLLSSGARHVCLYGGSRAGKTAIILYALLVRACRVKCRQLILRLTFNSAKRSIWLDSLPAILHKAFPDLPVKWNKTDYYIELPNGSQIFVGGLDDKERTEKVLGTEYSGIFLNEISQIPYSSVQIALSRLAEKNSLRKIAIYDMNPSSKSDWPYWVFEKKLDPIDNQPLANPDDYASMLLTPNDNLEHIDENYLKILEGMPQKEKDRFLHGLFSDSSQGSVYYEFNRERHVAETKIENGTLFLGQDWNVTPMVAVIAQFLCGKFYFHDEVWLENSDTYKMCSELKKRGYSGAHSIPDSSGSNRKTSGKSDFDIMKEAGFTIVSTKNPFIRDRCNNANRLLASDRIVINPKCKKLINDLEKVSWKDDKIDPGPDRMLGHITDAFSYVLWRLDPIGRSLEKYSSAPR